MFSIMGSSVLLGGEGVSPLSIMGSSVLLGGEGVSPLSIMASSVLLGGEGASPLKASSTYKMILHDRQPLRVRVCVMYNGQ